MTFDEFSNKSDRQFQDISSETKRTYYRPELKAAGRGVVEITNPIALSVSDTAHYVADSNGTVHRIAFDPARHDLVWETEEEDDQVVR
jgi:sugar lactone lactonase YvrE